MVNIDMGDNTKNKADVVLINKSINEYYEELHDDLSVTIYNLRDKALSSSAIRAKWVQYFMKEKENQKRLKSAKSKAMDIYLDKWNTNPSKRSILNKKMEDDINSSEPKMVKLNKKIEEINEIVIFLEYSLNILNDYGFTIKNAIETLKLEQV